MTRLSPTTLLPLPLGEHICLPKPLEVQHSAGLSLFRSFSTSGWDHVLYVYPAISAPSGLLHQPGGVGLACNYTSAAPHQADTFTQTARSSALRICLYLDPLSPFTAISHSANSRASYSAFELTSEFEYDKHFLLHHIRSRHFLLILPQ